MRLGTQKAVMLVVAAAGAMLFAESGQSSYRAPADCKIPASDFERQSCEQQGFDQAEAELNRTYRALRDRLMAPDREVLAQSQAAWIRERDAQCGDGGDALAVDPVCATQITAARADWLGARLRECKGAGCHVELSAAAPAARIGTR